MPAKLTQAQVIEKFRARHGDRYDYSNVVYTRSNSKVVIVCPEHGEFQITPSGLLSGKGCGQCGKEASARKRAKTTEQFVAEATALHEGRYSYPRTVYDGQAMPITITCAEHGDFTQTPNSHLSHKSGCPVCAINSRSGVRLPKEEFISRCVATHGERYDYSKTVFCGSSAKVTIGCPDHGWFDQLPYDHVYGSGCPRCAFEKSAAERTQTTEWFVARAKALYGDTYDYSETVYTSAHDYCTITCRLHGPFTLCASEHVNNSKGCPKCGALRRGAIRKQVTGWVMDRSQLEDRLAASHGSTYQLVSDTCNGALSPLTLLCPEHGEFTRPAKEIFDPASPRGCQICGREYGGLARRYTAERFIATATAAHNGRYDYSLVSFVDKATPVIVICPDHGPYSCHPGRHALGGGVCQACGFEKRTKTTEKFISDAREKHGEAYDYSATVYTGAHALVEIVCPKHGPFSTMAYQHVYGGGLCPRCGGGGTSAQEKDMAAKLAAFGVPMRTRSRRVIPPQELDFYFPDAQVAVELCGLYWHCEDLLDNDYHKDKLAKANEKGIRLLTVFEDEWLDKQELVIHTISRALGAATLSACGARETRLTEVSHADVAKFYQENHLMGSAGAEHHLVLTRSGNIVAAASLSRTRAIFGRSRPDNEVELVRFCVDRRMVVHGALAKLCSEVPRLFPDARRLLSYVDLRWFTGSTYRAAGFTEDGRSDPGYFYVKAQQRFHRYHFAKHTLEKSLPKFDPALSEHDNMRANNYKRLYDCGQLRMVKLL